MKNKTVKRSIGICALSLACNGLLLSHVSAQELPSDLFSTPFDTCFADGYNISEVTQNQAYATAQCFTSLLDKTDSTQLGASIHTIMEYSVSWYQAAADKGHELAQNNLKQNLIALTALENSSLIQGEQLLASEKVFNTLDKNGDGLLSLAEASSSTELKAEFSRSDFDNDGVLSYGEYTILSGEATAAGN